MGCRGTPVLCRRFLLPNAEVQDICQDRFQRRQLLLQPVNIVRLSWRSQVQEEALMPLKSSRRHKDLLNSMSGHYLRVTIKCRYVDQELFLQQLFDKDGFRFQGWLRGGRRLSLPGRVGNLPELPEVRQRGRGVFVSGGLLAGRGMSDRVLLDKVEQKGFVDLELVHLLLDFASGASVVIIGFPATPGEPEEKVVLVQRALPDLQVQVRRLQENVYHLASG